jgi:hypothetical protein
MDSPRRDFLFRNRRWLLLALFLIGSASLLLSRARMGTMLARFLSTHVGGLGRGFWLHVIYGLAAAPRMLPALRARIPAAGVRPRWLQGIGGESLPCKFTVATAGLAVKLDPAWYRQRLLWGIFIAVPLLAWARRHTRKQAGAGSA